MKPKYNEKIIDQTFFDFMKIQDDMLDDVSDAMYLPRLQEAVQEFNSIHKTALDPYESAMSYLKEASMREKQCKSEKL